MAEEQEQNASENENINRAEKRIKDLSSKVETASQERDEARQVAEKAANLAAEAEKERDFFKELSTLASKHPGATDFQDKILEKVKAGYTPEDATVSVLNAEGKLSPITNTAPMGAAGGGSASTVIPSGERSAQEMTQEERRAALTASSESGELAEVIKNWGRG